jgi:hypothetical protein
VLETRQIETGTGAIACAYAHTISISISRYIFDPSKKSLTSSIQFGIKALKEYHQFHTALESLSCFTTLEIEIKQERNCEIVECVYHDGTANASHVKTETETGTIHHPFQRAKYR